ncbi:hypothetical protein BT96DRAFT_996222 [Gymnopus androsaceus JB14]|uniref:Uncharacterized protein n=1 Tax=Gymnopus androsaceus JB14 TaxID=1447944 RepID=A0A6A4HIJ8_9AGAR|nr:hypothetical protein BT96DRAFT_996222 [Gymnopus androsaceus JB14]
MVAKKYKTAEGKRRARRLVNAQNYARNRDKIAKHRQQKYADGVQEQQRQKTAKRKSAATEWEKNHKAASKVWKKDRKLNADVKRPRSSATHKPNTVSREMKENRNTNIPLTQHLPSSCVKPTHKDMNEINEIEYLMDHDGPLRPKVALPITVFQLAFNNVCNVFLDYKAVIGPNWISGFFNRLHAMYAKDGDADIVV